LYSLNKITEMLEADRSVMRRAMMAVKKPDGYEGRQPRYALKTVVNALVVHKLGVSKKPRTQVDERQLLLRQQRIAKERQNAVEARELLPASEVEAEWSDLLRSVRDRMLAIPARAAQRVPHLSRIDLGEIDREIRNALAEASTAED
jgi:terminase small subunit / prophage DNA-packing protein